jgi:hypothetical protein
MGIFNPFQREYTDVLADRIVEAADRPMRPRACIDLHRRERETTIIHYRRRLRQRRRGHEPDPFPPVRKLSPWRAGHEVFVMKETRESDRNMSLCLLFNQPDILTNDGRQLLISGDFGVACGNWKSHRGSRAHSQRRPWSVDIDTHRNRDWDDVERAGTRLRYQSCGSPGCETYHYERASCGNPSSIPSRGAG